MISATFDLAAGLLILAGQGFALFLMILGAVDLYTHITDKRERVSE